MNQLHNYTINTQDRSHFSPTCNAEENVVVLMCLLSEQNAQTFAFVNDGYTQMYRDTAKWEKLQWKNEKKQQQQQ